MIETTNTALKSESAMLQTSETKITDDTEKRSEINDQAAGSDIKSDTGTNKSKTSKTASKSRKDGEDDKSDFNPLDDEVFLNAPRRNCHEIAPGVERILLNSEGKKSKHIHLIKSILSRNRDKNVANTIERLLNFDKSDKVIPDGEISKALYTNIANARRFNKYGNILKIGDQKYLEEQEKKFKAELKGEKYRFIRSPDKSEAIRKAAVPVFDYDLPIKAQPITSGPWKVGMREIYNAPVGFARDPAELSNSEGHEKFYAYDGEWKNGKMDGQGHYEFRDGKFYDGFFKENRPHGAGFAQYPVDSSYNGEWSNGKFSGEGVLRCEGGTVYEGLWKAGKRHGKGVLHLPGGLVYDGEWFQGAPHGRGTMRSQHTEYTYEGNFEMGFITGSGALTTPDNQRIVRYWPVVDTGLTLTGLVRLLAQERADFIKTTRYNREVIMSKYRQMKLQDYVTQVRTELHEGRAREKLEMMEEEIARIKAAKKKLRDEKIRLLTGEEASPEDEEKKGGDDNDDDDDDNNGDEGNSDDGEGKGEG